MKPALIAAFSLCFVLCVSAFAIPAWIGNPARAYTLTYKIYQEIQMGGGQGIQNAAAYSIFLFFLALPTILIGGWDQQEKYALVGGKPSRNELRISIGRSFLGFQFIFWASQLVFWIAPLGCLAISTLVKPGCLQQEGLGCLRGVSLGVYRYVLFELSETRAALRGSLIYGSLSALLISGITLWAAALFHRSKNESRIFSWIIAVPYAAPGAVLALALIVSASGAYGINLYNTPWIAVAAYFLKHFNLSYQAIGSGLAGISPALVEAARVAGVSHWGAWRRIMLPILLPDLLGGFFLVFIPILGELTVSVFLQSPKFKTIGTVLYDLQDYSDQASAAALSMLLVFFVLVLNELTRMLSRGKLGY